jgi:hypothetical protein
MSCGSSLAALAVPSSGQTGYAGLRLAAMIETPPALLPSLCDACCARKKQEHVDNTNRTHHTLQTRHLG